MAEIEAKIVHADYHTPYWRGLGFKLSDVNKDFVKGEEKTEFSCEHANTTWAQAQKYCPDCGVKRSSRKYTSWKTGNSTSPIVLCFADETGDFLYHKDDQVSSTASIDLQATARHKEMLDAFMKKYGLEGVYTYITVHNCYD